MSHPLVLCLGEVLFDLLADQPGLELAEVTSWTAYPGGAPANVACALVKLGTAAAYLGCVGSDAPGDQLVALLKELGVDVTGVIRHPTAPTRQVYVVRSLEGDRHFAGFGSLAPDQFADAYLDKNSLPESLFLEADYLVLGSLELAYPQTREAISKALTFAEQYNLKIILDVNWRPAFWPEPEAAKPLIKQLLKKVDFLKLSREEAEWLFDTQDAGAIAHRLDAIEGVIVTGGAQTVSYCLSESEGTVTPPQFAVVDTTGAGDSFLAGFIHQLCQKGINCLQDPKTAQAMIEYACLVGGLTTTKAGAIAAQPTAAEVGL